MRFPRLSCTLIFAGLSLSLALAASDQKPQSLRGVLLEQLRSAHDQEQWFVPIDIALAGLTPQQASWSDGKGNHSIGQLANHLLFWDQRELQKLTGKAQTTFDGNNDETFNAFNSENWKATIAKLDAVMKGLESYVQNASDAQLAQAASDIAHVGAHNAYHLGQIIYVRKLQGCWNPDKGVK